MTNSRPRHLTIGLNILAAQVVGFDNAHRVAGQGKGATRDHRHRLRAVKPYDYTDAGALKAAFWNDVESMMREQGVWT